VRTLALKLAATMVTLGATAASAMFVTGHIKNSAAPLQPPVMSSSVGVGSVVVVAPAVQPTTASPITSTYAS
jgi:hypothetical protein